MEISPMRVFWLLVWSLGLGALCGALNDVSRLVRVMMGVRYCGEGFERLYEIKLPIINRPLKRGGEGRLGRALLPAVIFLQDIFLFAFAGCGAAVINYYFNYGRLRIYAPLLTVLGFLAYYFTLGKGFAYLSEPVAFAIRVFFTVFLAIIYCPVQFFVGFLVKISKKMYKNINKALVKRQKKVYNRGKENFVMKKARSGFVEIAKK